MSSPTRWLALLGLALWIACAKSPAELEAERRALVGEALSRHLDHEEQMLALLERHRGSPELAALELTRYVDQHAVELESICAQRRLLEAEPTALATALQALASRSHAAQTRRQKLYEEAPTLMEHPGVKRALGRLDTL
ncbi:MAG TPA: hypothetical protein PK095_01295 [Myxococcota bacterium]|nr:hypothetical protein [Myxococcota bacterium]